MSTRRRLVRRGDGRGGAVAWCSHCRVFYPAPDEVDAFNAAARHDATVAAGVLGVALDEAWLEPGPVWINLPAVVETLRAGVQVDRDRAVVLTLGLCKATGGIQEPSAEEMLRRVFGLAYDELLVRLAAA